VWLVISRSPKPVYHHSTGHYIIITIFGLRGASGAGSELRRQAAEVLDRTALLQGTGKGWAPKMQTKMRDLK